jgi:hypothetical protein
MKFKIFLVAFLLCNLSSIAQDFKTPVDFLNYLSKEQVAISRSTWKYTSAVAHSKSARRIDVTRKQLIKSIETASKKIADLKEGYKGDLGYRDQVLSYFDICKKNLNEEYDKIINMQEVSEQSYDAMEAYLLARDLINEKLDSENQKVENAFNAFAAKYKITITEGDSELGKKIKISNEVFDYHTALYLIFYKVNFTDASLSKAIEKKDLTAIQQNTNALIQYADEGLEKIKAIKPYNNDASILNATKKTLEYYKKQALQYCPKVVDFLMFNDKFDNAKKTLEAKSQKDRTEEEINNYNAMVKQVNKEITDFNKVSNTNFQEKNTILNEWETIGNNFISKHVPAE